MTTISCPICIAATRAATNSAVLLLLILAVSNLFSLLNAVGHLPVSQHLEQSSETAIRPVRSPG